MHIILELDILLPVVTGGAELQEGGGIRPESKI